VRELRSTGQIVGGEARFLQTGRPWRAIRGYRLQKVVDGALLEGGHGVPS
jgi:hypothetical protein